MDDIVIKNALSYSLASDLHETWRLTRRKEDGTYEPRIKKSTDEEWNIKHGTDEVDIANCSFDELPSNWQYENLSAAKVAIDLVYDKTLAGENITAEEKEQMASVVHDEWLKRNDWVFDSEYGDPNLAVSYENLSEDEKYKDKIQLDNAQEKVKEYAKDLIDIEELCTKYNLEMSVKRL